MFDRLKLLFRFLDRTINSSRTPEEYILNGGLYPAIIRSKEFLANYKLNSVITAQLYDSSENLYYHNNDISIVFDIRITPKVVSEFNSFINNRFPPNTFINFFMKHTDGESQIVLSVSITTTPRNLKTNKKVLLTIKNNIVDWATTNDISIRSIKPKDLICFYNKVLAFKQIDEYDNEKFIFEQVFDCEIKDIDNDGIINFNDNLHTIFYSKQYPNLAVENYVNPFITLLGDIKNTKLNFYYSFNIVPNKNDLNRFNTTLVLIEEDASKNTQSIEDFINYFRYKLNWYIYPNKSFSLAQFINSLPLQYTKSIDEKFINSSINQIFPKDKLIELLPIGELNEPGTN